MTAAPVTSPLSLPVNSLWGVGAERAGQLARLNIFSAEDLILHRPRRYEDRRRFRPICELELNAPATTRGEVVALGLKRFRHGQKSVFELILSDGRARLHCRWWNLPFMEKYFAVGNEVVVFGKLLSLKPRTMDHPETEVVETGEENFIHLNRITPVYPLTEGLPQRWLRSLMWRTLEQFQSKIPEPEWSGPQTSSTGILPVRLESAHLHENHTGRMPVPLPSRADAIRQIHFPENLDDVELARRRLALDEFVDMQMQIRLRRKRFESRSRALPCGGDNNRLIKPFLHELGFKLTGAQSRVLREIRADMRGEHPMRRLLQGDVGSGKTVVAACAALMAIESGYNVALMAPTEILAAQHDANFRHWLEPLNVGVELRTGSQKIAERATRNGKSETRNLKPGTVFIGTHALISAGLDLPRLGLVIIDEQHKFGVAQREQLVRKGWYPHLLVMTATPIPRTLGLTVYGELDMSVIDAPPPGRGRIKTFVRSADKLPKVWSFVREKLAEGRQAYVVYPRVEEGKPDGIKAVTREFENLKPVIMPFKPGLLHGRMKPAEKDKTMRDFRANVLQVLLSTSLIEVGVDVPNATVMVIENAESFGLAQLHQLRGRIGRGAHDSYCILVAGKLTEDAQQRLRVLEETTDGFRIAEADLNLRGPGELLGKEQSGVPDFRFGDLALDFDLIKLARQLASETAV